MLGWLAAKNAEIECLGEVVHNGQWSHFNQALNKFPQDCIFDYSDMKVQYLHGYVYNKRELETEYSGDNWTSTFQMAMRKEPISFFQKMRGGFCGYTYDEKSDILQIFTDHTGIKPVYYFVDEKRWIVSDNVSYMVQVLKSNHIAYAIEDKAVQYMLTYGFMIDDSTFVKQIHRLLPGHIAKVENGKIEIQQYYQIPHEEKPMSEQEAVEKIDQAFRQAIQREFDKDIEYGYKHLVDLSGGLDSRMVAWVAHNMGYTNQMNMTYCQAGYQDDKISKEIAKYLNHEYIFKILDDAQWMYDIDEVVSINNGAALYLGITGGNRMLSDLQTQKYGIEHTGMIGDAILSTFYHDRKLNEGKPRFGLHQYSEKLQYMFDETLLSNYSCQELFAIYTRGMLGAQTSYIIRQQYVETASPFMDVDFLNTVFQIPFEYRMKHHIYLKWMLEKYPDATKFGWEKWGGIKPKESHIFFRKFVTTKRLLWQAVCKLLRIENRDIMIPVDFWYYHNPEIQDFYERYFDAGIQTDVLNQELKQDMTSLYQMGTVTEKSMVLTVLAIINKYFGSIKA